MANYCCIRLCRAECSADWNRAVHRSKSHFSTSLSLVNAAVKVPLRSWSLGCKVDQRSRVQDYDMAYFIIQYGEECIHPSIYSVLLFCSNPWAPKPDEMCNLCRDQKNYMGSNLIRCPNLLNCLLSTHCKGLYLEPPSDVWAPYPIAKGGWIGLVLTSRLNQSFQSLPKAQNCKWGLQRWLTN